jgi:cytoskeletal protein CcmA (bactofilin family)
MALKGFMAKVERGLESTGHEELPRPAEAARPVPRTVAPSTSVDASSVLEGRLRCKQTLRIDGRVEGEIDCEKAVIVGEAARILASIEAEEVQISGVVEGNIAARRKITLERTAVVIGDLTTPGIVIEEGAKLKGRIVIGSDEEHVSESAPAEEAKKSQPSKKAAAAAPKRSDAPAPQPVAAAP